jgi:NADPH-dependent ferric siderophore reductase
VQAIIEVADAAEEQLLACAGDLDLRWLHRNNAPAGAAGGLAGAIQAAINAMEAGTYVWVACERSGVQAVRDLLKKRGHDRKQMYVAWYWERHQGGA